MPFAVDEVRCPACGEESIVYDEMNTHRLHCTNIHCPRMMAVQEILAEPQRTDHLVVINTDGYSVKHPLIERLDDKLPHCKLASYVAEFGHDWLFDARQNFGYLQAGVTYRMWDEGGITDIPDGRESDWDVCWPTDDTGRAIPFEEEHRG
jgi:ribosomal protein S27AE